MAKKKFDPEKNERENNARAIQECEEAIERGILGAPPKRRTYKVGQRVKYGAHKETYVREVHADGRYYIIENMGVKPDKYSPPRDMKTVVTWTDLLPYNINKDTNFAKKERFYLRMLNSPLSSLVSMVHRQHAGVDFDVDYQREHVWTRKDKIALIDSIFNNVDIGKFVFVQRNMRVAGKLYEIIDGKQRLTAITEFVEDRWKYKGFYFSELSFRDQHKFLDHNISYGYLENPSKEAIFETFIKVNTCGKPMASKHINHVKHLLKELNEIKQQVSDKLKEDGY